MADREKWTRVAECVYRSGDTYQVRLNNPLTGRKEIFGPDDGVIDRATAITLRTERHAQIVAATRDG